MSMSMLPDPSMGIERETERPVGVDDLDPLAFFGGEERNGAPLEGVAEQVVCLDVQHLLAVAGGVSADLPPQCAGGRAAGDDVGDVGADRGDDSDDGSYGGAERAGVHHALEVVVQGRCGIHGSRPLPRS